MENEKGPRQVSYLPSGHTIFSEGETLIECQFTSDPTSTDVPTSKLADFIHSRIKTTVESMGSTIVTAARNQPDPAALDQAGVGNHLPVTVDLLSLYITG